jgi:hypothetical protein
LADGSPDALPDAVVVCVHGGTAGNGTWECAPDVGPSMPVESLARVLKTLYPKRPLIFATCNADGLPLHVRGVWYARGLVLNPPGGKPGLQTRWGAKGYSRIADFVEGD